MEEDPATPEHHSFEPAALRPSTDWSQDTQASAKAIYDQIYEQVNQNLVTAFSMEIQQPKDANVIMVTDFTVQEQ